MLRCTHNNVAKLLNLRPEVIVLIFMGNKYKIINGLNILLCP